MLRKNGKKVTLIAAFLLTMFVVMRMIDTRHEPGAELRLVWLVALAGVILWIVYVKMSNFTSIMKRLDEVWTQINDQSTRLVAIVSALTDAVAKVAEDLRELRRLQVEQNARLAEDMDELRAEMRAEIARAKAEGYFVAKVTESNGDVRQLRRLTES